MPVISLLAFLCLFVNLGFSQDADSTAIATAEEEATITASVQFDRKEVPQNRNLLFTAKVSWTGDLDRYEIEKLEAPVLTNFEMLRNSSSNRVGQVAGVKRVVKTYEFVLEPVELGMAYVDGMIIEYVEMVSGKKGHLLTNRLEAKVIDPIEERSLKPWLIGGGIFLALLLLSGASFNYIKRKKAKEEQAKARALERIPIEEKYLSDLKGGIDLQNGDAAETFSILSKIFRGYLAERYDMPARGMTTQEIASQLGRSAVPESLIEQTSEVLNSCDVAKFSGGDVERGAIERAYTLVEDMLTRNKATQGSSVEKATDN